MNRVPTFTGYLLLLHGLHLALCSLLFWVLHCTSVAESGRMDDFLANHFYLLLWGVPVLYFVAVLLSSILVRYLFRSSKFMAFQETKFPQLVASLVYFPFVMILTSRMYILSFSQNYTLLLIYLMVMFPLGFYLISFSLSRTV